MREAVNDKNIFLGGGWRKGIRKVWRLQKAIGSYPLRVVGKQAYTAVYSLAGIVGP
jgi:hypothetical protein